MGGWQVQVRGWRLCRWQPSSLLLGSSLVREEHAVATDARWGRKVASGKNRIQESQLRRHLDLLDRMQEEKDVFLQKTR